MRDALWTDGLRYWFFHCGHLNSVLLRQLHASLSKKSTCKSQFIAKDTSERELLSWGGNQMQPFGVALVAKSSPPLQPLLVGRHSSTYQTNCCPENNLQLHIHWGSSNGSIQADLLQPRAVRDTWCVRTGDDRTKTACWRDCIRVQRTPSWSHVINTQMKWIWFYPSCSNI